MSLTRGRLLLIGLGAVDCSGCITLPNGENLGTTEASVLLPRKRLGQGPSLICLIYWITVCGVCRLWSPVQTASRPCVGKRRCRGSRRWRPSIRSAALQTAPAQTSTALSAAPSCGTQCTRREQIGPQCELNTGPGVEPRVASGFVLPETPPALRALCAPTHWATSPRDGQNMAVASTAALVCTPPCLTQTSRQYR